MQGGWHTLATKLLVVQGQQSTAEDIEEQGKKAKRSSSMQVLLVRAVEKLLDGVCHRLRRTAWSVLLDDSEGHRALQVSTLPSPPALASSWI